MGERGKLRPVYRPPGTTLSFQWPMGITRGQRDYLTRVAKEKCDSGCDPRSVIKWLEANAWRHLHTQDKGIKDEIS